LQRRPQPSRNPRPEFIKKVKAATLGLQFCLVSVSFPAFDSPQPLTMT
jgi:hypothetical protein